MEVTWKVWTVVMNAKLNKWVGLYDSLHVFREGRGTGTATLEAKLVQQLASFAHEPLFQFFLDVLKSYDSLDRGGGGGVEIFKGYGMGPYISQILGHYWENNNIMQKAGKFTGQTFGMGCGVTQGDPA